MNDELLQRVGPCGLHCGGCLAFSGGPIHRHAEALAQALGPNFAAYAARFAAMGNPVFENYPAFRELLDYLAQGECTGCRDQGCLFKECKVPACCKEQGVDFCFQCAEFPCHKHGFSERLAELWQKNNEIMRAKGLREYYEIIRKRPRYP